MHPEILSPDLRACSCALAPLYFGSRDGCILIICPVFFFVISLPRTLINPARHIRSIFMASACLMISLSQLSSDPNSFFVMIFSGMLYSCASMLPAALELLLIMQDMCAGYLGSLEDSIIFLAFDPRPDNMIAMLIFVCMIKRLIYIYTPYNRYILLQICAINIVVLSIAAAVCLVFVVIIDTVVLLAV